MKWRDEWKALALMVGAFAAAFFLPIGRARFDGAVLEGFHLVRWYAREHILLCLVPAFFIAGALGVFVNQSAVMKYLGARANRVVAYSIAAIGGTIIAVCSCTILPLFGAIYKRGAGLGPAVAFLYSGPAISVLAIILTARILGLEIGVARAVGAVGFSVLIGLAMQAIFREKTDARGDLADADDAGMPLWKTATHLGLMVGILVTANWSRPVEADGLWFQIWHHKWAATSVLAVALAIASAAWLDLRPWAMALAAVPPALFAFLWPAHPEVPFTVGAAGFIVVLATGSDRAKEWLEQTWSFAKQILPLLLGGVFISGFLLGTPAIDGRPPGAGVVPSSWIAAVVGGDSLLANAAASFLGAFMYFATLTEVPIVQGLMQSGMGKGPALALLLAGPAVSLPSLLVIRSFLGTKKTVVFLGLVIVLAAAAGWAYGRLAP